VVLQTQAEVDALVEGRRELRLRLASAEVVLMHCNALLQLKARQGPTLRDGGGGPASGTPAASAESARSGDRESSRPARRASSGGGGSASAGGRASEASAAGADGAPTANGDAHAGLVSADSADGSALSVPAGSSAAEVLSELQQEVERLMAELGEGPGSAGAPGAATPPASATGRFKLNWSPARAAARAAASDVSPAGVCMKIVELVQSFGPLLL
jgi:hypothetical protein